MENELKFLTETRKNIEFSISLVEFSHKTIEELKHDLLMVNNIISHIKTK